MWPNTVDTRSYYTDRNVQYDEYRLLSTQTVHPRPIAVFESLCNIGVDALYAYGILYTRANGKNSTAASVESIGVYTRQEVDGRPKILSINRVDVIFRRRVRVGARTFVTRTKKKKKNPPQNTSRCRVLYSNPNRLFYASYTRYYTSSVFRDIPV